MDERLRKRRRAVGRERGRRRAGWLLLAFVLVVGLGSFLWLRSSDVFAVTRITCTTTQYVTVDSLVEATSGAMGVSLLRLGLGHLEERLRALPYVRSAEAHRQFPNTLTIVLVEYQPVACIRDVGGSHWLVADDGRVLERRFDPSLPLLVPESEMDLRPGGTLPSSVVEALPVTDALGDEGVRAVLPEVRAVLISSAGELTISLAESMEVRLGEPSELKHKLKVSGVIIQQYLRDGRTLQYVDARVPGRVAVKGG